MRQRTRRGEVSIFIVIFAALMISVLLVSFMRIMVQEQNQATNSDLSQSAYDSALAGVEDAKRVVQSCKRGNPNACSAILRGECNTVAAAGVSGSVDGETLIQTRSSNDGTEALNQAYTCVKVSSPNDYRVTISSAQPTIMVPIGSTSDVTALEISWTQQRDGVNAEDLTAAGGTDTVTMAGAPLFTEDKWGENAPAILRAQIINPGGNFQVGALNDDHVASTAFLYPYSVNKSADYTEMIGQTELSTPRTTKLDATDSGNNRPLPVHCSKQRIIDGTSSYACRARINLSQRAIPAGTTNAYLQLNAFYRDTVSVGVRLFSGENVVGFIDGQHLVDSTGRANNLFRRVEARLSPSDGFPYPNAAVDIAGSLCKDFRVLNEGAEPGLCTP